MANKLTKEKIDLLIEQVLSEVSVDLTLPTIRDIEDGDFENDNPPEALSVAANIGDINTMYEPFPIAPGYKTKTGKKNLTDKAYSQAVSDIAKLDGDPTNISYRDVKLGLGQTKSTNKYKVSKSFRDGRKFKDSFDYAIANSVISKYFKKVNDQDLLNDIYEKTTNRDILNNTDMEILKTIDSDLEEIVDEYDTSVSAKILGLLKSRRQGIAGMYANLSSNTKRTTYNDNVLTQLNNSLVSGNADFTIQKKVYNIIKDKDNIVHTTKNMNTLATTLKNNYNQVALRKALDYDPKGYSFPSNEKPPQQKGERNIDSPLGALQISYSGLSPQGSTFEGAGNTLKANISADPSFIATVDAIEGTNMMDKIANLAKFANDIENKLPIMEVGKSSSYLRMLGFLSDAAREYEDASAGTVFETFLAASGQGIIIGGESGAADVVTMAGGNPVYYSAKLYSSKAIEQSDQANIGFGAVAAKAVEDRSETGLIYVIGIKTNLSKDILTAAKNITFGKTGTTVKKIGEASRPKAIAMCVLNIIPKDSGYDVYAISGAKKYKLKSSVVIKEEEDKAKKAHLGDLVQEVANNNLWHSYVPIFFDVEGALQSASASGAESIKKAIDIWGSETLKKLAKAFANLREMDLLTQEHTAKQGELTTEQHMGFINGIETERKEFAANYKTVSDEINPDKNAVSETKSLKDLDKLIEHVILNKMNK